MKSHIFFLFIFSLFSVLGCINNSSKVVQLEHQMDLMKNPEIKTDENETQFGLFGNSFVTIFETSFVLMENDQLILQEGTFLVADDNKMQRSTLKQIRSNTFFFPQWGGFVFFQLVMPSKLVIQKSDVIVSYEFEGKEPQRKKSDLILYDSFENFDLYGFYIPFHPLVNAKKYRVAVDLEVENFTSLKITSVNQIQSREFPVQILNFSNQKSKELSGSDRTKYKQEQVKRIELWNRLSLPMNMKAGIANPVESPLAVTSEFALTRKWMLASGTLYSQDTHMGVDYPKPKGSPVFSILDGTVVLAEKQELYGNMIIIDHGMGLFSNYCHLNDIEVKAGDGVKRGDFIGTVGMTGAATGPHLHIEARINAVPVDYRILSDISSIYEIK